MGSMKSQDILSEIIHLYWLTKSHVRIVAVIYICHLYESHSTNFMLVSSELV